MISYKYKLYHTSRMKYLNAMLSEACFVWNHALSLQKRYYKVYHKYISLYDMERHQAKRFRRNLLSAQNVREILERLDNSYKRFFQHISNRPPKFKRDDNFSSIVFKGAYDKRRNLYYVDSCKILDNYITIKNKYIKNYRFHKSRQHEGNIKRIILKRNCLGEYFLIVVTDAKSKNYEKSHNGASVGIDFGLKTYLTLSDGTRYENPLFMKECLTDLRRYSRNLSKCKKGSNNRKRKRMELDRLWNNIYNKRDDYQWKLAHELCKKYDKIFIEDLELSQMKLGHKAARKLRDQAHFAFVQKLFYVATKYGVVVHKIDRYYPSSKSCSCGYINNDLKLSDRKWVCPHCGEVHDRDLLAANNILRRGIVELESDNKTSKHLAEGQSHQNPTISL